MGSAPFNTRTTNNWKNSGFDQTMATMTGHLVVQIFTCCIEGSDEPIRNTRPRIDRSMIGQPMDFRHTAHIGQDNFSNNDNMGLLQTQMKSKGGYNVITNAVPMFLISSTLGP